mmetsp:Transcript_11548/g.32487  ORF Transcript_11548/g.32487 Transcript_11548/m.32487 type:complete len:316 (-) Transcript_11548:36-983(-)
MHRHGEDKGVFRGPYGVQVVDHSRCPELRQPHPRLHVRVGHVPKEARVPVGEALRGEDLNPEAAHGGAAGGVLAEAAQVEEQCGKSSAQQLIADVCKPPAPMCVPLARDVKAERDRRIEAGAGDVAGSEAARDDDEADGQAEEVVLVVLGVVPHGAHAVQVHEHQDRGVEKLGHAHVEPAERRLRPNVHRSVEDAPVQPPSRQARHDLHRAVEQDLLPRCLACQAPRDRDARIEVTPRYGAKAVDHDHQHGRDRRGIPGRVAKSGDAADAHGEDKHERAHELSYVRGCNFKRRLLEVRLLLHGTVGCLSHCRCRC